MLFALLPLLLAVGSCRADAAARLRCLCLGCLHLGCLRGRGGHAGDVRGALRQLRGRRGAQRGDAARQFRGRFLGAGHQPQAAALALRLLQAVGFSWREGKERGKRGKKKKRAERESSLCLNGLSGFQRAPPSSPRLSQALSALVHPCRGWLFPRSLPLPLLSAVCGCRAQHKSPGELRRCLSSDRGTGSYQPHPCAVAEPWGCASPHQGTGRGRDCFLSCSRAKRLPETANHRENTRHFPHATAGTQGGQVPPGT